MKSREVHLIDWRHEGQARIACEQRVICIPPGPASGIADDGTRWTTVEQLTTCDACTRYLEAARRDTDRAPPP